MKSTSKIKPQLVERLCYHEFILPTSNSSRLRAYEHYPIVYAIDLVWLTRNGLYELTIWPTNQN